MKVRLQVPHVLYVDPHAENCQAFSYALVDHADVVTAQTPEEALRLLTADSKIAVVVTELQLGAMTGVEFMRHAHEILPGTVNVVVMDGFDDASLLAQAVNSGLVWRAYNKADAAYLRVDNLAKIVDEAAAEQARRQCEMVLAMVVRRVVRQLVQRHEKDADGSVARREHLAQLVRPYLDMSALELALLPVAALVHGLELVVPSVRVRELLSDMPAAVTALRPLTRALDDARECFNGTGPNKKVGAQISPLALVIAVVDKFDLAISATQELYEVSESIRNALEVLQLQAGVWYDPSVVAAFAQMVRQHRSAVEGLYWTEAN